MSKARTIISICTTGVLAYYIVKNGMDMLLGATLTLSVIANILNLYCEVKKDAKG